MDPNISLGIDSAQINDMLIIGGSDASSNFAINLKEIGTFTRFLQVKHVQKLRTVLSEDSFSVIIIDNCDSSIDPVSLSQEIRSQLPLVRIIVISDSYSPGLIKKMINHGTIDSLVPLPIDRYTASSIIIEQYAKFQINQNLYNMVSLDPPKFSPSYFLLNDPSLNTSRNYEIKFVGTVIIYSGMTKFAKFYSEIFNVDEYLITGYISAISLLAEQLFEENYFFQEINFGGLSVIMHLENEVQYLLFFEDLTRQTYQPIETEVNKLIQSISRNYYTYLTQVKPLSDTIDVAIEALSDHFAENHKRIVDYQRRQKVVLFGNQLPKLNTIFSQTNHKYEVSRYMDQDDLLKHVQNYETDIIIINQVLREVTWNFNLANQLKEINPSLKIVALLRQINQSYLLRILNDDYLDYVLSYRDSAEEIHKTLDLAFNNALRIKSQLVNYHPLDLQSSLQQSVIARSMLRAYNFSFQISQVPKLYALFIMYGEMPYYSRFWDFEDGRKLELDEQLFSGFLTSMQMFSEELFEEEEDFSGFRFGDLTVLIKHQFNFDFVYFCGNIDHTNYLMLDKLLSKNASMLYEFIVNSEGFFDYDMENQYDITELLEQYLTNLMIRLESLNFF